MLRTRRLIDNAIASLALDLRGLTVLTEAATGPYALTAALAARAGADRVLTLARSSRYGSADDAVRATRGAAYELGVEARVEPIARDSVRVAEADVVTNLAALRPLDTHLLARLKPGAAVALMWETWEHRADELDLDACRRLGIPVLGTNERHPRLRTLAYTGHIALKLLYSLGVEGLGARLVLLGRGPLADESAALLAAAGAHITAIAPAELPTGRARAALAEADALVVIENVERGALIGPGGALEAAALAALNPALVVAHVAGAVDRDALVAHGLRCAPEVFARAPHLSVPTDYLGPRPVIDLHAAGLAVGAALARARRDGLGAADAEARVLATVPFAQGFTRGLPPRAMCVTLDLDWAPDCAIDAAAAVLLERGVRATWFVTHASPAVERLRRHPELFELGVHPNFLPGSTHGSSAEAVLDHCMALVPDARAVRAHCLAQSTPLTDLLLTRTPLRVEASLFLPGAAPVRPFAYRRAHDALVRVPYTWEDTFALAGNHPLRPPLDDAPVVLGFHPIHVALNSRGFDRYTALKRAIPALASASPADLAPFTAEGHGVGVAFREAVDALARHGGGMKLSDYAARECA